MSLVGQVLEALPGLMVDRESQVKEVHRARQGQRATAVNLEQRERVEGRAEMDLSVQLERLANLELLVLLVLRASPETLAFRERLEPLVSTARLVARGDQADKELLALLEDPELTGCREPPEKLELLERQENPELRADKDLQEEMVLMADLVYRVLMAETA